MRRRGRIERARTTWGRRKRGRPLAARAIVVAGGVAALSTTLPWFSYSWGSGAGAVSSSLVGLHDVTGRTMLGLGAAEGFLALGYLFAHPGIAKRWLRVAMVLLAFYMITVPLAAMAHASSVPGSPAVDVPAGALRVDATGAIGVVIALLAALVVLGASWLTVLDSVGETVPNGGTHRS